MKSDLLDVGYVHVSHRMNGSGINNGKLYFLGQRFISVPHVLENFLCDNIRKGLIINISVLSLSSVDLYGVRYKLQAPSSRTSVKIGWRVLNSSTDFIHKEIMPPLICLLKYVIFRKSQF
jgi:hypothetical protein